jgi:hypothetical protein
MSIGVWRENNFKGCGREQNDRINCAGFHFPLFRRALFSRPMRCIVTAGPTFEPLDQVRRLTNHSTGRLGSELTHYLAECGHELTLLIGQ